MLTLSRDAKTTAGVLLLAIVAVEYGGTYMLQIVGGRVPLTTFQQNFARAGHAHAGVLVILALVCQMFADAADLSGLQATFARNGVAFAAILMPAGFFLSSIGAGRTAPNRLILLVWAGAAVLAIGAISLGAGLLTAI
jgi:hypothetical protein